MGHSRSKYRGGKAWKSVVELEARRRKLDERDEKGACSSGRQA